MRKILALVLVILSFQSCRKESFLRISSSEVIKSFVPDLSSARIFSSSEDSISITLVSQDVSYEEAPGIEAPGSLGDFDKIEVERRNLLAGVDTPFFRFSFDIVSSYFPASLSRSKDVLTVSMREEGTASIAEIQLEYIDSLKCLSPNCAFSDTLMIDSLVYLNVYYLDNDPTEPNLYLNSEQGLVGFKTTGSTIYKRLN